MEARNARRANIGQGPYVRPDTSGQDLTGELLNAGSLAFSPVPVVSDILGLAADARMYQTDPASRTMGNYGMTLAGVLPFVPGAAAVRSAQAIEEAAKRGLDMSQGVSQAVQNENLARFMEGSFTPQRLYHATPADFEVFKPGGNDMSLSGRAIFLTDDASNQPAAHNVGGYKGHYNEGTNVMPLYANISKPLIVTNENLRELKQKYGDGFPLLIPRESAYDIMDDGYDGVITRDIFNGQSPAEYVVFDSTQLKSAIGNIGTYDPVNPNIMAGVAGATVGLSALRNINNDEQPSK